MNSSGYTDGQNYKWTESQLQLIVPVENMDTRIKKSQLSGKKGKSWSPLAKTITLIALLQELYPIMEVKRSKLDMMHLVQTFARLFIGALSGPCDQIT